MNILIQGCLLGLTLSFMIGPLLFAIVQAGISQGFRAGLSVAIGIWISDFLYIALVLFGLSVLANLTALPGFKFWAGLTGSVVLIGFGLASLLMNKAKPMTAHTEPETKTAYWIWGLRGFLLNTINPFTVFFWLSIAGAVILPNGWDRNHVFVFFTGMMGTLIVADITKAYTAKKIGGLLHTSHIARIKQMIGLVLIVFGVVMLIRVV